MSYLRRTAAHTAIYGVGIMANRAAIFALTPLLTRALTKEEYGMLALCMSTTLFVMPFLELGTMSGMGRCYFDEPKDQRTTRVFRAGLMLTLLQLTIGLAILLPFSATLAELILGDPAYAALIALSVACAAATVLGNLPLTLMRVQERSIGFSVLNLAKAALGIAAVAVLAIVLKQGVAGVLWGELASLVLLAGAALAWNWRQLAPAIDLRLWKKVLQFSLPFVPMQIANMAILSMDPYFLRALSGAGAIEAVALYAVAFRISSLLSLATRALQTAWPPSLYRIAEEEDGPARIAQIHRLMFFCVGAAALAVALAAPELIGIFSPADEYAGAIVLIPALAFGLGANVAVYMLVASLHIPKKTVWAPIIVFVGLGIKVGLNFLLIPHFGPAGAAYALLIACTLELAFAFWVIARHYPTPYDARRLATLGLWCIAGIAAALAAYGVEGWQGLALRGGIGLAFGLAASGMGVLTPKEIRSMARAAQDGWKRLRRGKP